MQKVLRVRAPAKINLGLTVLGKRPDGFHEIESVMQQVSLSDSLLIEPISSKESLFLCTDPGLLSEENLVWKAAELLAKVTGRRLSGIKITLFKNIPVAAGLAGGSSDAAAVLRGLNSYWQLNLDQETLFEIGARLGSDVPYCLLGGTALARGRGEILKKLVPLPHYWVTLVLPAGVKISTADAYKSFNREMLGRPSLQKLVEAINNQDRQAIENWVAGELVNTLESAELPGIDSIRKLKTDLRRYGFKPVLSGSGPTLFM
ncbi:MAG: 4-(cytidine 5'-diphospho)-2-C-methyl-D-erythritol kinase, partial [Dethiobacteria bacterium]